MEQRIKKFISPVDMKLEALDRKEVSALSFFRLYLSDSYLNCVTFVFAHVEQSRIKMIQNFDSLEKDVM